jgi:hypothetical protein
MDYLGSIANYTWDNLKPRKKKFQWLSPQFGQKDWGISQIQANGYKEHTQLQINKSRNMTHCL